MVPPMEDGAPAIPDDLEAARLRALGDLRILDTPPEPCFDRIVRTAATVMDAPRAALVFIDRDRLWLKARVGVPAGEFTRARAAELLNLCRETLAIGDVKNDARFSAHTLLLDGRFFGCAPLTLPSGETVGLLAVGDPEPHGVVTQAQKTALSDLAALAVDELVRRMKAREAEEQRLYDEKRVALALEAAGLGEFEWNITPDEIYISPRVRELTGIDQDSVRGEGGEFSYRFVHPDDIERVRREVEAQLSTTGRYSVEYRMIRPSDNRVRWMRGAGVLTNAPDGSPRVIGVLQDITERQLDEEDREALLAELDHRVKNVLAAVQSLASQSARRTTSLDSFLKTFAGRLKAMASAHELLTATRWRGAAIGDIAAAELGGLAPGQARWEGPEIVLTPRAANALSLALHELASNAVKFGALSADGGKVQVAWRERDGGGFILDWEEKGGPPVSPPTRKGFGSTLLESVTQRELGGPVKVDFRRSGVVAQIEGDQLALADQPPPAAATADRPQEAAGASVGQPEARLGSVKDLRLMIVEDSVLLALELEAGLVEAGAEVIGVAVDLDEAYELAKQPFDAAVLDVNLNGRLVTPLAETLLERGTPFVFATGYGETGAPEGFDVPIVRKPYNVHQIVAALVEATGKH